MCVRSKKYLLGKFFFLHFHHFIKHFCFQDCVDFRYLFGLHVFFKKILSDSKVLEVQDKFKCSSLIFSIYFLGFILSVSKFCCDNIKFKGSNPILTTWKTYVFLMNSGVKELYNLEKSYVVTLEICFNLLIYSRCIYL